MIGGGPAYGDPGVGEGRWKPRENECCTGDKVSDGWRRGTLGKGLSGRGDVGMTGGYEGGGVFPELSLRRERELVDLRSIDDNAEVGPERFDDVAELPDSCESTEISEVAEAAESERRLSGRGGIGGCEGSVERVLTGDGDPNEVLLFRRCPFSGLATKR